MYTFLLSFCYSVNQKKKIPCYLFVLKLLIFILGDLLFENGPLPALLSKTESRVSHFVSSGKKLFNSISDGNFQIGLNAILQLKVALMSWH